MLLLSGDLDVATPTFRSQEVADALPNATLVVFPGRTHVQIAGANICAGQIMTQFVLDPTATAGHELPGGGSRGGLRPAGWQQQQGIESTPQLSPSLRGNT